MAFEDFPLLAFPGVPGMEEASSHLHHASAARIMLHTAVNTAPIEIAMVFVLDPVRY
jgi:hypothetical protein